MGGRGSRSGARAVAIPTQTAAPVPIPPAVIRAAPTSINATQMTAADVRRILDEQEEDFTADEILAIKQYISQIAQGNGYSMSQNMNYKLNNGSALNANEKFVEQYLTEAMHPIGKDVVLYRGAHQGIIEELGVMNYDSLSESQLQSQLVGASWVARSFTSTSYDASKSPFLSGPQSGGREVVMNIHAAGSTNGILANRSQAECILGIGTNFRITGVRYTGKTATPRAANRSYKQIELDVEAW